MALNTDNMAGLNPNKLMWLTLVPTLWAQSITKTKLKVAKKNIMSFHF